MHKGIARVATIMYKLFRIHWSIQLCILLIKAVDPWIIFVFFFFRRLKLEINFTAYKKKIWRLLANNVTPGSFTWSFLSLLTNKSLDSALWYLSPLENSYFKIVKATWKTITKTIWQSSRLIFQVSKSYSLNKKNKKQASKKEKSRVHTTSRNRLRVEERTHKVAYDDRLEDYSLHSGQIIPLVEATKDRLQL